jgi:hypothetical protein
MKEFTRFKRWADQNRKGRGLLCHFYETNSKKQYYTESGYAYFNILSEAPSWIIRGTTDHGMKSERRKTCQAPVLNCYKIDDIFYDALENHCNSSSKKYEVGIVLSKAQLKNCCGVANVVGVELWEFKGPRPAPSECWRYDLWQGRRKLIPFNNCNVVRARIPTSGLYGLPIKALPRASIMALLVKEEGYEETAFLELLERKGWKDIAVFPLL